MAPFTADEARIQQLDWRILRGGGICLYWRPETLAMDQAWFESNGYRIVSFDCAEWSSQREMHDSLKVHLLFPDYYGMNSDALDECMCDDLVVPDTGGLVLVLGHYDRFARSTNISELAKGDLAAAVLDICARASRFHMLFGRRLLILVQSDDAQIDFGQLGGAAAVWNSREWLNKNRGL